MVFVSDGTNTTIDFAGHPSGVYFLEIQTVSGKLFRKKIIRQ
jgi:hypothetical protein